MLRTIGNSFAIPEIRRKLAFTAAMLALYRLGAFIPAPGVDAAALDAIQENFAGGNILGFLNLFSGGALSQLSLFALGIMPYITASIILQLLTVVVPSLEKLQKEGEVGQQKITQYTRYLTVGLAFAQSLGYVFLFESFGGSGQSVVGGDLTFPKLMLIVISLTAGCTLLMWLGELITQRGIGNGISLMIFASIVSGLPARASRPGGRNPDQVFVVMMPFVALAVIVGIVFVQEGQRRIPVQYAKRDGRAQDDHRRLDLPAAARQHGRRHPGHLRGLDHGLPADRRAAPEHALGARLRRLLQSRLAGPTSSARSSSSSSSPTSTRRSRSIPSTRPTT